MPNSGPIIHGSGVFSQTHNSAAATPTTSAPANGQRSGCRQNPAAPIALSQPDPRSCESPGGSGADEPLPGCSPSGGEPPAGSIIGQKTQSLSAGSCSQ
ncbi:hypothetical protein ACHMW6_26005 [Pseudoduganella sp. UC29_106]|uniref:hypothetical protein n=1 Tax=Pseudoduganella sp. UC29_106 TaxID=3374553 RepID=UPI0037576FB6